MRVCVYVYVDCFLVFRLLIIIIFFFYIIYIISIVVGD